MRTGSRLRTARGVGRGRVIRLFALWGFILASAGGLGMAAMTMIGRPPDPVALCRKGGPVAASTVVLVDTTDALSDIQRRRLETTIAAERDRLSSGGRLSVLAISALSPDEPVEIASLCDPGNASDVNPLFQTESRAQARFADEFDKPLAQAIDQAARGSVADRSPIIESMSGTLNRPDFDTRTINRRLVVISDMLEYRKGGYSQLKGGDLWRGYVASGLCERALLDLRGVSVAIDYLARPAYAGAQGEAHRSFWRRLLTEAGAADVTFVGRSEDALAQSVSTGIEPDASAETRVVSKLKKQRAKTKSGKPSQRRRK